MLRHLSCIFMLIFLLPSTLPAQQENSDPTVDIVWLKDGSKLRGTILSWELDKGMNFKLTTGATIYIQKNQIQKVMQEVSLNQPGQDYRQFNFSAYSFREKGWYQNSSGFLNISILGGVGIHHAMGYRFNRYFGVGLGTGIETHDFDNVRNIVPVYAEIRGFLVPKKISPYYAVKIGYGFALNDQLSGTTEARGGFHFSPELGVRFGGGDVNYYLGMEYKIQNARFTNDWWGGGSSTDEVSYRRLELRTGLLF